MPKATRATRPRPGCVVIHCSDPRYQKHFHRFLRRRLGAKPYALVAVPGGPQLLARGGAPAGWRWVRFLGTLAPVKRLVLIAHDDCRWYFSLPGLRSAPRVRARQRTDLRRVRTALRKQFAGARVELFFARLAGRGCSFRKVR
jgi:hypothetical protein